MITWSNIVAVVIGMAFIYWLYKISDYGNPSKIRMQRKMETDWAQKIYKKRSKTAELPFAHIKQNMKLHEFTTTGIKNTNTEFKLYTIGHNLKRIYNEINTKNN